MRRTSALAALGALLLCGCAVGPDFQPPANEAPADFSTWHGGASELAAMDGITKGKVEDFLVARIDPDADDEPIVVMAWSDLAASIAQDGAEEAAIARLAEIGVEQSVLREAMARKVVN